MKKLNTIILGFVLAVAVASAGCSKNPFDASSYDHDESQYSYDDVSYADRAHEDNQFSYAAKWAAKDITFGGSLDDVYFDGTNTTFTYTFTSNPEGGPAISHLTLALSSDCFGADAIISSSDPSTEWSDPDPTTGVTGIKFDTGFDDEELRTVTLTLAGEYEVGVVQIAVKAATAFVMHQIGGPVCGDTAIDETYTISGTVYFDANGDGVQGTDEPGIPGLEVFLSDGSSEVTDDNGYYEFEVEPGEYSVSYDIPAGFNPTTNTSADIVVTNEDENADFGITVDLTYLEGQVADGYTIGFWKNNIKKALSVKTNGTQVSAAELESYLDGIETFALAPFSFTGLNQAYQVLSSTSSGPVELLAKQLIGSEFNFFNGAYIGGNEFYTSYFLFFGEYVIVHAEEFSAGEILNAKDLYDAYNNSHGEAIAL